MFRAACRLAVCAIVMALCQVAFSAETETLYLSGKGKDDPVKWDFMCSAGQNAGTWSTIGVPSNWELQGFGIYTYGTDKRNPWPKVQGQYKRTFTVPAGWSDKKVFIVFEGVMTDTQVRVNGQSAGPMHQGGYYRFKYDITKLLKAGENLLEVTVDDESANPSVNNAERRGDYWNYAGIFRPVYLEAVPQVSIQRVAIDARADGSISAQAFVDADLFIVRITAQARDLQGQPVGNVMEYIKGADQVGAGPYTLTGKIDGPRLWTAETPNLYQLEVRLEGAQGAVIHSMRQRFGFRTVEARPNEGLFLNGQRIMLKGADRHIFWPDSGRCVSEKISRDDIQLMKDMNMNAVRCSHYPPDQHFLDACDEMGLYVLDELAGWHQSYDTPTGRRLIQEMIARDVNHPSILFWDNGNEGGWNTANDGEFAKNDPQKRLVLHPWEEFPKGIADTKHYPDYALLQKKLEGPAVYLPTEFLHGLYDGGLGAGMDDYWQAMMRSKVSAGGFFWVLADESLKRTDKGGKLDSNGNQAPDGIVGPYREKEGSFYTIRELWSPIVIPNQEFGSTLKVENRFAFTDLQQCSFSWELRKFGRPQDASAGYDVICTSTASTNGSIPPGTTGSLSVQFPPTTMPYEAGDAEALTAKDPAGRVLWTWVWPIDQPKSPNRMLATPAGGTPITSNQTEGTFTATAGDLQVQFSKKTGLLAAASRAGKTFSFVNGPRLVAIGATPPPPPRGTPPVPATMPADSTLTSLTQKTDGNDLLVTAAFDGPMKSITYRVRPNGWLTIDYAYNLFGPQEYFGVGFDYPEANVQSMRYLGNGPAPVYQNRLAGGTLNVWEKKYNNTMVGDPDDLAPDQHYDYPVFKGYYNGVRWLQLSTSEGPITALLNQGDLFVQVFTPKLPPASIQMNTKIVFPNAGISFLHAIPAMGSKFAGPRSTGPQGQPAVAIGDYKGSISLYFGELRGQ